MPSFDIVSEVDLHELTNAVDQVNREIGNRFDFKGSDARVEQNAKQLTIEAENEFQAEQILPMLKQRMAKRGLDVRCLDEGHLEVRGQRAHWPITVREGIDQDLARKITAQIKSSGIKVQCQVQGEQLRISGKKRDDLQAVIAMLRETDLGIPLQFSNFRD